LPEDFVCRQCQMYKKQLIKKNLSWKLRRKRENNWICNINFLSLVLQNFVGEFFAAYIKTTACDKKNSCQTGRMNLINSNFLTLLRKVILDLEKKINNLTPSVRRFVPNPVLLIQKYFFYRDGSGSYIPVKSILHQDLDLYLTLQVVLNPIWICITLRFIYGSS